MDPDDPIPSLLGPLREQLDEDRPYALADVAGAVGLPLEDVRRVFVAGGRWQEDDTYAASDLAYAREFALVLQRLPLDVVERSARARLRAVTQIVIGELSTARLDRVVADAMSAVSAGADEQVLAAAFADIGRTLIPAMAGLLAADYRHVMRSLLNSSVVEGASRDFDRNLEIAIGFVDLVGFTRLSAATDPIEVGAVLNAFEEHVHATLGDIGDILLAKTIGDAVMLCAGSADDLVAALLQIVEGGESLADVGRRAGMSHGEVLVRDGDYIGHTVNMAARLTDLARPGAVLVDETVADRLDAQRWQFSRLPPISIKGLGTRRPVRVRPRSAER